MFEIINSKIYCNIPDGVGIGKDIHGNFLFSTKNFKKGEVIYIGKLEYVKNPQQKYELITNIGNFTLDKDIHFVSEGDFKQVYSFDSFFNHSCDANTYSTSIDLTHYYTNACKDIEKGDQLTCDYNLFDYECCGHQFEECLCGSSLCEKKISGFKNLNFETKLKKLNYVDDYIKDFFIRDDNVILIEDLKLLDNVEIKSDGDYNKILSKKKYAKDDLIYSITGLIFNPNEKRIVYKFNEKYHLLGEQHIIYRSNDIAEFIYFDIFMNHSCNPSTYQKYSSENTYNIYANKEINVGDELVMDYNNLDNDFTNERNIYSINFKCKCGEKNCRGIIFA